MTKTILPCLCGTGFLEEIEFFGQKIFHIRSKEVLQQKDLQLSSSKTIAINLKRMYWYVELSGPALQFYLVFMLACFSFVVWGEAEPFESLWLIEQWNNALTSKWICFKHIDVISCFCCIFTIPVCHGETFTAAEEACSPGDQKKKQSRRERKPLACLCQAAHKHNLKWMLIFALHQATVRPQMLHLTLCLRACESRPLLEADELYEKKKKRDTHKQRGTLYLSDRVGLEIFWLSRHDPSQSPHLKCWLLDTTWSYCDMFKNLKSGQICFFDCDVAAKTHSPSLSLPK